LLVKKLNNYEIIIVRKNSKYIAEIQELGIIINSDNEIEALKLCTKKRDEYLEFCNKNNIKLPIAISSKSINISKFINSKILYFILNLITNFIFTALLLFLLMLFIYEPIEMKIRELLNEPSTIELLHKILDKLEINISKRS
tara:strand:- start:4834 stop:5259 length:426 start_codon:yes stop_codon:yes gene_type:complete